MLVNRIETEYFGHSSVSDGSVLYDVVEGCNYCRLLRIRVTRECFEILSPVLGLINSFVRIDYCANDYSNLYVHYNNI